MYRIDTPNAAAVKPAYGAVGTQGYFQDTAPGGSTDLSADFFNHMMEELATVIEAAGLTLDKADDGQLEDALRTWDEIGAVISDASDTGSVSTTHTRAVIASFGSRASGSDSAVVAGSGCLASGPLSASLASDLVEVSGTASFSAGAASSSGAEVSGDRSALVCCDAGAYDLTDDDTLAGAASGALTWAIHSDTGDAEFTGTLDVGGGYGSTGASIAADGDISTDGDIVVDGNVEAGTLDVGGGYGSTGASIAADGDIQTDGDVTVGAGGGAGGVSVNAASGEVIAEIVNVTTDNAFKVGSATGVGTNTTPLTFTTTDGKTVTVKGGIITSIV